MPNKIQFNQKLNSRLRRLIHFRPHGIGWRSNTPDGSCRQLSPKIFVNKTFWGSPYWRHPSGDFKTYIKRLSFINRAGFISSAALFTISLLIIFPIYYKTNLAEAAGSLSDTTLSITSDNLVAGVDLLVTSNSGTFASSTSPMTFNVTTNNATGYMLSISAKTGTDLTNTAAGTSFTSLDATNSTIAAGITADTFGNISNTVYNNQWGFKPNYYKSAVNSDKFYPSPTTSGIVLNKTTCANNTASSDSPLCQASSNTYTIAIGARATYSQVAGTYSNTYILSSVGNYPIYKITYTDTTGDGTVANLPAEQKPSSDSTAITVKLSSTTPTRTGYTFSGWCTVNTTTCSNENKYNPGDTYNLSTLNANTVTLYATWTINQYTCTKQYRLQNADGTFPSTYTVDTTEQINYNATCTYTKSIANYKYGSATATNGVSGTTSGIMGINGLTLSLDFYRNTYTLTVNRDTNHISSVSGGGTYRWGQSASISATAATGHSFTSWSQTSGTAGSFGNSGSASTTFVMPTSDATVYANGQTNGYLQTTQVRYENADGSWGNYSVAESRNVSYGSGYSWSTSQISGFDSTVYQVASVASYTVTGANTNWVSIYRNTFGVDINPVIDGVTQYAGLSGFTFDGYINGVLAADDVIDWYPYVRYGSTVRVVANAVSGYNITADGDTTRTVTSNLSLSIPTWTLACSSTVSGTMQGFNPCSTIANGTSGSLTDSRDGQIYTVKKINGQWWMTRNLAIGCNGSGTSYGSSVSSKTLTSANSNVSDTWNTPTDLLSDSSSSTQTADYSAGRMQCDSTYGAWYNYAAATAGTITGASNTTRAAKDVCPLNWYIPGDLVNITTPDVVAGGFYWGGILRVSQVGQWWSNNNRSDIKRWVRQYSSATGDLFSADAPRYYGLYVRCVHD